MAFDPSKHPRDEDGQWATKGTAGAGGHSPTKMAKDAVSWLKSDQAKAAIAKISAPDNVKAAATMAIQSALFAVGVNDPHVDQEIKRQVNSFATDVKVTRAHARQLMINAIQTLKKVNRDIQE